MDFFKLFVILFDFHQIISSTPQIPLIFKSYFGRNLDPCQDFYQLSCHDWWRTTNKLQHEPVWNRWIQANNENNKKIQKILDIPIRNLEKVQIFYKSCLQSDYNENMNLDKLQQLIKDLGDWPVINHNHYNNSKNWLLTVIKLNRIMDISPILKFHIDIDYKNTTQYVLYIEPGSLIYPQQILLKPTKYPTELRTYQEWIYNTIQHIYKKPRIEQQSIKDLIKFEMTLAKLQAIKPKIERLLFRKFTKKFPYNWQEVFNLVLLENRVKIDKNDVIIVRNYNYFKNVLQFFGKFDHHQIQNYLIWYLVKDLSRDTTKYLRNLNFLIDKTILGVSEDFQREFECTDKTIQIFDYKIAKFYEEFYLETNWRRTIQEIYKNIQTQFVESIETRQWLSGDTRRLIVEKIKKIRLNLGYPQWIDAAALEDFYKNLQITPDYFVNILETKLWKTTKNFNKFRQTIDKIEWPTTIFDVNAYYSILQNSIFIPLGLLVEPFYASNRSIISNYGALGSLIGHELSHSIDMVGRQADQNGNIRVWWSEQDLINYQQKLKCFNQQNNEEIADHIGIKLSLNAYRNITKTAKFEQFFTSFAQMWCDFGDKIDIFDDNHPVMLERVRKTLQQNQEFAKIHKCNQGNYEICELW